MRPTTTALQLSASSEGPSADDPLLDSVATGGIDAGASAVLETTVTIPSAQSLGTYYIWAAVDAEGVSGQENTSNDTASTLFQVTGDGDFVQLGPLTLTADVIQSTGPSTFVLSGDVRLNDLLQFTGEVTADVSTLSIAGDGTIYLTDIPVFEEFQIYQGAFEFAADADAPFLTGMGLDDLNSLLALAGLPVTIDGIEVLSDGVRIEGELGLPDALEFPNGASVSAEITQLQITQSEGLDLVGSVEVQDVRVHGIADLKDLLIEFNTIEDSFLGAAKLRTTAFGIDASASVISQQLQSVEAVVMPAEPVPIPATGLSISEGGGAISGIADPPLTLELTVSIVPSVQGSLDAVQLNDLTITYTFGSSLVGTGNVSIFDQGVGDATVTVTSGRLAFEGNASFLGVIDGSLAAAISARANGGANLEGQSDASLTIPALDGFPFDYVSALFGLPYTVAQAQSQVNNTSLSGFVWLSSVFELTYALLWEGGQLFKRFRRQLQPLQLEAFRPRLPPRTE